MSKIDELIQQYCPNGVESIELSKVAVYANARIPASFLNKDNYVGVDNLRKDKKGITPSEYVPTEGAFIAFQIGDILLGNIRPYLKKIWLANVSGGTNGDVLVIRIKSNYVSMIIPRYLFYILSSDSFFGHDVQYSKGAKMPRGDKEAIMRYRVFLPPLPVQEEIVRILDKFTQLEAELEAELEARRKQYEFYRDKLLNFNNIGTDIARGGYKLIMLRDLAIISTGSHNTVDAIVDGAYNFYVRSPEVLRMNSYDYDEEAVITSGDGVGVGKIVHHVKGKYALHQRAYRIHPIDSTLVTGRYIYHYMKATFYNYIMGNAVNSSVTSMRRPMLEKYTIPVPSIEEQNRITGILDKFDALVNDISTGLPAEINARRQQYEYYRDQLLSFATAERAV